MFVITRSTLAQLVRGLGSITKDALIVITFTNISNTTIFLIGNLQNYCLNDTYVQLMCQINKLYR